MKEVKWILALFVLFAFVPVVPGHGQPPKKDPEPEKVSGLMKRKLQHSQKVLEGLALNDFDLVSKHANELIEVSKRVEWKVIKTPQYETYSSEFRQIADDLVKSAKNKNPDGVTLSYVELTFACAKCHKYVRDAHRARND